MPPDVVKRALAEWGGFFTDEQGHVIGFLGLSIRPMPHRLTVTGRTLYAWCAFDTLFLPELLGAAAEVESRCPSIRRLTMIHRLHHRRESRQRVQP
jgi:alkylmercury lyase